MAREQRCLVYSIDAILGLTGNGQRSASTTVGRRSCRDESNDECQLQTNDAAAAAASRNGRPGIGRSLHFSRATYDRRNHRHHYHHVYRHQSSQLVSITSSVMLLYGKRIKLVRYVIFDAVIECITCTSCPQK